MTITEMTHTKITLLYGSKNFQLLTQNIEVHHTYLKFDFYFTFYRNMGNRDGRLPV